MITNENSLPSKDTLDKLSYKTGINKNLNKLSIDKADINIIKNDIIEYRNKLRGTEEFIVLDNKRLKPMENILAKYEGYMEISKDCVVSKCFNDIVSIRVYWDGNTRDIPKQFKVAKLKKIRVDEHGYKAMHLYYQKDKKHYPIEIQLWQ